MYFNEITYSVMPTAQPAQARPKSGHETTPAFQIFAAYTKPSESAKPDSTINTNTSTAFQDIEVTRARGMQVMYAKKGGTFMHKLLLPVAVALLSVAAHAQAPAAKPTLQDFAWLGGHWRLEQADRQVDEQWMAPSAGLMMGMARSVQGGKVREYE